jgi:adenylate cyclase
MTMGLMILGTVMQRRWERDIFQFMRQKEGGGEATKELESAAQHQVLNLPFRCALISLFNWGLATVTMTAFRFFYTFGDTTLPERVFGTIRVFIGVMGSGIVTGAIVFFAAEILCRRIWPYFFPQGGLAKMTGTFRLKLGWRMFIAFVLASILPMILMAVVSYNKARMMLVMNPEDVIQSLFYSTGFLLLAELSVAVTLSYLVSTSIVRPVKNMEQAMTRVQAGDLSAATNVSSNDELGALAENFNKMVEGLREREYVKETFGRFVAPAIAQAILENPPKPGGESTEVSILFSDIRNYTSICERLTPGEVIKLLNAYFSYMVKAIEKHQGLVYQFVGDAIMAVFGAPVKLADHATCAVNTALEMNTALDEFNRMARAGQDPLRIGVGVNTGNVVAGIIGTEERMEYRVVGDAVNLAARIEALNKELNTAILISKQTRDTLSQEFNLKAFPPVRVKGKEQVVQVYAVLP